MISKNIKVPLFIFFITVLFVIGIVFAVLLSSCMPPDEVISGEIVEELSDEEILENEEKQVNDNSIIAVEADKMRASFNNGFSSLTFYRVVDKRYGIVCYFFNDTISCTGY